MFKQFIKKLSSSFHAPAMADDNDIVYFGGIEPSDGVINSNGLMFALYVPMSEGLVYLPYSAYDEAVIKQLESMKVGEAFRIVEEVGEGCLGGEVRELERIQPLRVIRIKGLQTDYPDAPEYPVQKL